MEPPWLTCLNGWIENWNDVAQNETLLNVQFWGLVNFVCKVTQEDHLIQRSKGRCYSRHIHRSDKFCGLSECVWECISLNGCTDMYIITVIAYLYRNGVFGQLFIFCNIQGLRLAACTLSVWEGNSYRHNNSKSVMEHTRKHKNVSEVCSQKSVWNVRESFAKV